MMKKSMSKKSLPYKIDLTEIEGDGSFPCPKCGTVISPEDETEQVYKIVETKLINDELVELVIMCSNCGSKIKLTGFEATIEGLPTR
ncbi:hypothetical protein AC478_03505 [miscellaneous Crenarchaeota group-1 archaeon SG8-32-3]|uniref:Uncharacterized protein n=1 Tax=miscellaneous Crenarchaeota group-1 archaeon SG8-32-3 TaxID=1685125 RepID=A0A0M0BQW4_9ARCH|nr:MAG: hypothetical protein AC478_03505 [miscellaneous Crenarchaeota group-1 archaeon SG8-32-3]